MLTKKNNRRETSMPDTSTSTAVADSRPESIPTAIDIQNFSAFYDDFQAIHNLSLSILDKKVTAFIGPSGCGKSTPKSIYDNVAFGARLHYKISRSELDNLVEWSLKKAAIWEEVKDRLDKPANGLSGGQKQRLCIARAIAVGPEILLMDEPCSALDPGATAKIENLIYELSEQYTIVIVTLLRG